MRSRRIASVGLTAVEVLVAVTVIGLLCAVSFIARSRLQAERLQALAGADPGSVFELSVVRATIGTYTRDRIVRVIIDVENPTRYDLDFIWTHLGVQMDPEDPKLTTWPRYVDRWKAGDGKLRSGRNPYRVNRDRIPAGQTFSYRLDWYSNNTPGLPRLLDMLKTDPAAREKLVPIWTDAVSSAS